MTEQYDVLVIGSGEAGKYVAWTASKDGHRTALVERSMIGGSCPNVACLPSKNVIHSAKVANFAGRAREFGVQTGAVHVDMTGVRRRKREMVDALIQVHQGKYDASGVDLIMGEARFMAPKTVAVRLNDGRERTITAERVVLSLGTRASIPGIPVRSGIN